MRSLNYKFSNPSSRGFTLAEIVVVVGITGLIMIAVSSFQVNILNNNKYSMDSLTSAQDARTILRTMVKELRSTSRGNDGSAAISQAATNTISFYSDIDTNGLKERIRYFLATTTLKKGVITPTGSPLGYTGSEVITTLAINVKNNSSSPFFEYYDDLYAGTSSPLTQPVSVIDVRLVKINLIIDADPNKSPLPKTYTSQVSLRNLKDNI